MTKIEYEQLVNKLNEYAHSYYVNSKSLITDYEYDMKLKKIEEFEKEHKSEILPYSPTLRVGSNIENSFNSIVHKNKLLSLENTYNIEDLYNFDKFVKKELLLNKDLVLPYVLEQKIDGLSIAISYKKGIFEFAATRGNGEIGEDVSENIKTIKSLPLKLNKFIDITIRAEVFLSKKEFLKINIENEKQGKNLFQNPRNAASGSLRQKNSKITAKRNLDLFVFDVLSDYKNNFLSRYEMIKFLKELGFKTIDSILVNGIDEAFNIIKKFENIRNNFDYEIDGMVLKIDSIKNENQLGNRLKTPKWAVAYKFKAKGQKTKLIEIEPRVGRTGVITPRAKFMPVNLLGTTTNYATLHNQDYIDDLDIRIGDTIVVEKAADVIPKVVSVIKEDRKGNEIPYKLPQNCPVCNELTKRLEGESALRCINDNCPAKDIAKIIYFASKQAMDIDGLGKKIVENLANENLITDFTDIYSLYEKKSELLLLDNWKEKKVNNLLNAIEKSKNNSLEKLIAALGIELVGIKAAKILAKKFKNIDNIENASLNDFLAIDGIGDKIACSLKNYFEDEKNLQNIQKLKKYGVNMNLIEDEKSFLSEKKNSLEIFKDKKIVITGKFVNFKRDKLIEIIESAGGKFISSINKSTDFLIVGENAGSKFQKAKNFNINIIEEENLYKILQIDKDII